jgi:hypothetical protein
MKFWRSLNPLTSGRAALLALLLCVPAVGCGAGTGEVSGTVRYNGKPLPSGTIQFLGADGIPCAARIQPDGTYSVQLPPGPTRVIVSCVDEARLNRAVNKSAARNGRMANTAAPDGNFSLIPQRYSDWDASGLTVQVQPGPTTQDFNLTPN